MKTPRFFIAVIIGFCFALVSSPAVFGEPEPAAQLSSEEVTDAGMITQNVPADQLPPMDFAPVDTTGAESADKKDLGATPKSSRKIREYWLKIHADEMAGIAKREETPVEPGVKVEALPVEAALAVGDAKSVEEKPTVAPTPAAAEPNSLGIDKPIPHTEAPVVVQNSARDHRDVVVSKEDFPPVANGLKAVESSSGLPLFSSALAKMTARRAQREAEAKRLNIILPSQGGAADKVPASLKKLNAAVSELIERRGGTFGLDKQADARTRGVLTPAATAK